MCRVTVSGIFFRKTLPSSDIEGRFSQHRLNECVFNFLMKQIIVRQVRAGCYTIVYFGHIHYYYRVFLIRDRYACG